MPTTIRNLYRSQDALIAIPEVGEPFEVGEAERSFYARPHEALDRLAYEEAPGGWLKCYSRFAGKDLPGLLERWRRRGVDPLEADVRPVDRALADLDLRISGRLTWAMIDLECAEPPLEALKERRYAEFPVVAFAYRTSDGKRGTVLAEARGDAAERALLKKLGSIFRRYDVVLAWNGGREWDARSSRKDGFDFPVIRARAKALGIDPIDWQRACCLDHMDLYYRRISGGDGSMRQSLALDAVARSQGIDDGKLSLKEMLRARGIDPGKRGIGVAVAFDPAPELVREYVQRDVDLMAEIEKRTGFLEQHLALCQLVNMLPRSNSLTPSRTMDALLLRMGYRSGHHWPTRLWRNDDEDEPNREKIIGAAVRETEPGIIDNVVVLDVASLYPSLIRALNLGPDTKCEDGPIAPIMTDPKGEPTEQVIARFASHERPSQIARALEMILKKRREYDARAAKAEVGSPEYESARRLSTACKVVANSFYGVLLQPGSRFYDSDVGSSVTATGRLAIRSIVSMIEARGHEVRIQDTDSAGFVCADPDEPARLVAEINDRLFPSIMARLGVPEERSRSLLQIKHEETFSRLLLVATKKYAGLFRVHKGNVVPDGKEVEETKGLELVKGDTIRRTRELQREVVMRILRGEAPGDVRLYCEQERERFLDRQFELADVAIFKRLSKAPEEYATALPHVRAAIEYQAAGLEAEGGKVRYWIAKGEQSRLPDEWDPAEVDVTYYWDKQIWPAIQRCLEAAWPEQNWDLSSGPKQVGLFGEMPSKKGKRIVRRVPLPSEVIVRMSVPHVSEVTPATELRDRGRVNRVRAVALENPGDVRLVVIMSVDGRTETRLETGLAVNPAAREKLQAAAIIPAEPATLFADE